MDYKQELIRLGKERELVKSKLNEASQDTIAEFAYLMEDLDKRMAHIKAELLRKQGKYLEKLHITSVIRDTEEKKYEQAVAKRKEERAEYKKTVASRSNLRTELDLIKVSLLFIATAIGTIVAYLFLGR